MNDTVKKPKVTPADKPEAKASAFWEVIKKRDIDNLRRSTNMKFYIITVILFLITIVSLLSNFFQSIKPTPVIAFDKQGRSLVFSDTSQQGTSEVRIRYFLTKFINKYEGVSPRIDEDLADAYNMMIPKFREILLLKEAHKDKVESWKGKNIETQFSIERLNIKGDMAIGHKIAVIGTGKFIFRPVVVTTGASSETFERQIYFTTQLMVMPVSMQTVDGLLVEFFSGSTFDDPDKLRAYLLENNIPLTEEDKGILK